MMHSKIFEKINISHIIMALVIADLLGLSACSESNRYIEPPPPDVTVSLPVQNEVTDYLEFTGTTQAVGFVEVRARVSGELKSMHFEPGTEVDKGQLLFIIDPAPYEAELTAAEADLASAKAEYHRAQVELERANLLIKKNFISKTDHLRRETERDVAKAAIGRMQAKVDNAKIQMGYTQVSAPIKGRAGKNEVDIGNLVGEGEATLLTTVTNYRPMYAYFHLNERDLLKVMKVHREQVKQKGLDPDENPSSELEIPVYLKLAGESEYMHQGILDFSESGVATDTGTIELRAVFPNQEKPVTLIPGLFASLRFPIDTRANALWVDESAFSSDQSGEFLLVVNSDNIVEKRVVTSGQVAEGLKVVETGLKPDDRVIVNGLQKARPGAKVKPNNVEAESQG